MPTLCDYPSHQHLKLQMDKVSNLIIIFPLGITDDISRFSGNFVEKFLLSNFLPALVHDISRLYEVALLIFIHSRLNYTENMAT